MSGQTRVLCVDDNPDITGVLRRVIDADPGMQCVGCVTAADNLAEDVARLCVDVVILDATMPGKDPIEAMRELASSYPEVKTIVYSGYNQPEFVDRVIDAGAWGSVSKHDNPDCVIRAISEIVRGRVVFPGRGR